MAVKFGSVEYTLFDAIKEDRLDFFRISRKKADTLNIVVVLLQIVISGADYFFLQESVLTVKVLKHLLINFVANVTLVHHNDILHTIDAIAFCIMVTDLRNQLEQQCRAFLIIDWSSVQNFLPILCFFIRQESGVALFKKELLDFLRTFLTKVAN